MKPRSLRHRLEKASKILVLIQKHVPDVDCMHDEDKGEHGHLVVDFEASDNDRKKLHLLGKDLENKGYTFLEKKSPWLGRTTYTGRAKEKPTIVITLPITKDRLAVSEGATERPFSFGD